MVPNIRSAAGGCAFIDNAYEDGVVHPDPGLHEDSRTTNRRGLRSDIRWRHFFGPWRLSKGAFVLLLWLGTATALESPLDVQVSVDWAQKGKVSRTESSSVTLIPYPLIRKGRALHEPVMKALGSLDAKYHRLLPYCSHPHLSVAALYPPTKNRTFWNFSLIDPEVIAFLEATKGREPILNFGPIPLWMFKGGDSEVYPTDPDKVDWRSCGSLLRGGALKDPTGKQVAEYFARIASWYAQGGFTDELGKYHHSGYHYEIPWWGVLNEPDIEHGFTLEQYTRLYDVVVEAVRKVSPKTRFKGMGLSTTTPQSVEYFLNPHNHKLGTPIDMASVHWFSVPPIGQSTDALQYSMFDQLSAVIESMAYIDAIRKRLSPQTRISIGEIGILMSEDLFAVYGAKPFDTTNHTPKLWWNLAAAFYAVAFIELSQKGADIISTAHFIGYPPEMMPSVGIIDPESGKPHPQFHVLKLLREQLSLSRRWIPTSVRTAKGLAKGLRSDDVAAQAFETDQGRGLLLVNKRSRTINVAVDGVFPIASIQTIDESGVTQSTQINSGAISEVRLRPFAVTMIGYKGDETVRKDTE
jgi:hypothetical protein